MVTSLMIKIIINIKIIMHSSNIESKEIIIMNVNNNNNKTFKIIINKMMKKKRKMMDHRHLNTIINKETAIKMEIVMMKSKRKRMRKMETKLMKCLLVILIISNNFRSKFCNRNSTLRIIIMMKMI